MIEILIEFYVLMIYQDKFNKNMPKRAFFLYRNSYFSFAMLGLLDFIDRNFELRELYEF